MLLIVLQFRSSDTTFTMNFGSFSVLVTFLLGYYITVANACLTFEGINFKANNWITAVLRDNEKLICNINKRWDYDIESLTCISGYTAILTKEGMRFTRAGLNAGFNFDREESKEFTHLSVRQYVSLPRRHPSYCLLTESYSAEAPRSCVICLPCHG